jgi:hypothetical protein
MTTNKFLTLINGVERLVQAIVASTGASDANKLISTGANGRIDNSFMPVGIGAQTETIAASEALTAGDFVNIYDNAGTRNVRKADASNGREANGFVLANVANAANATVYISGLNNAVTGVTIGRRYLSATTPGASTATPPSAASQTYQTLGYAVSTTGILFEYDAPIALDA